MFKREHFIYFFGVVAGVVLGLLGGFSLARAEVAPMFSVVGAQSTVTTNTTTKLTWTTERFDPTNAFSSGTFTPLVAGRYSVSLAAYCPDATTLCQVLIYKNGSSFAFSRDTNGPQTAAIVNQLVDMNGSTDYLEAYIYNGGGTQVNTASDATFFSGFLVPSDIGTSTTSTSSTQVVDNPNQDFFFGVIVFMFATWFMVWFFRKK